MRIRRYSKERRGAGVVEYGLIVGLIAVGVVVAVDRSGQNIRDLVTGVASELSGVSNRVSADSALDDAKNEASSSYPNTCVDVYQVDQAATTGVYAIDADGDGALEDQYCDFGGGDLSWAMSAVNEGSASCGSMSAGGNILDSGDYILQAVNFQGYSGFPTVGETNLSEVQCVQACEALGADACRQTIQSSRETCQAVWNAQISGTNWRSTICN